ncbi:GTPase [Cellulosimicrobium marinum]|uniref:GTPase n=1 Tax=Cellulosimicrobium marinum TaxID=1638992 RepID=UPI001E567AB7|nr:GTPase [Cellulosimicrobium marinum]MCB7136370.1 50S ribosome-binding GTPase [Cellulosimicrobium marinum]
MSIDLDARTTALESAARAGDGRLDPALLARARDVVARARERAGLSADHTVVALAGATGSGKSSVFNALAGAELATVGVRRPTTSRALAAVWGGAYGAGALLDWLEVSRRHEMSAPLASGDGKPDARPGAWRGLLRGAGRRPAELTGGLVLLDLPDHDSVVTEHRVRAERLVDRADLLVWVVDPQKYADAALHERYLRPLAGHASVVVLVLNQVDRLAPADAEACLADLRRLAAQDGLAEARVLGLSARTGEGMDALRGLLADAAARRRAAVDRLAADERQVARAVADACGDPPPERAGQRARAGLVDALEAAAGVPTVVAAVRGSALRDARAATGWPVTRWLARFRADPLRRLGLRPRPGTRAPGSRPRDDAAGPGRADLARTSLPAVPAALRAGAQTAVRDYVDAATRGVPDAWALAARRRAADGTAELADALDGAVVGTELDVSRRPVWWRVVGLTQWVLLAALIGGLLWLGVLALLAYLRLPEPPTPVLTLGGAGAPEVPWPTLLALGGLVGGVLLALVARALAAVGARRRAARARSRLRDAVGEVADRVVRLPVGEELSALARCRSAALVAAT